MIVLKFGGTSVESARWINNAIDITLNQIEKSPVIVSSAMGKTTNGILEAIEYSILGNYEKTEQIVDIMRNSHISCCKEFLENEILINAEKEIDFLFSELLSLLHGLITVKECSPRSKDIILSFGERLSTTIIYFRCMQRGINAELLDSRDFIKTDENFNNAQINFDETNRLIPILVHPENNKILITQGFIGSTLNGVTTTLGRGGSDYTATIIGSALDAKEVQIWTDVTGIMTSDPRKVTGAKTIENMTYTEAAELAYFGAKVVHPSTIQPAVRKSIPVWVKNTGDKDAFGTKITETTNNTGVKAISGKNNVTLINISSSKMLNAYGFLRRLFSIFEKYETPVDLISTSEVSVSITIDDTKYINEIVKDLLELGKVKVEEEKSIICLVGHKLWEDSMFIARVFSSIKDIPVRMISLGSSDTNLSFVVPGDCAENTIQILHDEFFKN